jgi:hypothetical protein
MRKVHAAGVPGRGDSLGPLPAGVHRQQLFQFFRAGYGSARLRGAFNSALAIACGRIRDADRALRDRKNRTCRCGRSHRRQTSAVQASVLPGDGQGHSRNGIGERHSKQDFLRLWQLLRPEFLSLQHHGMRSQRIDERLLPGRLSISQPLRLQMLSVQRRRELRFLRLLPLGAEARNPPRHNPGSESHQWWQAMGS